MLPKAQINALVLEFGNVVLVGETLKGLWLDQDTLSLTYFILCNKFLGFQLILKRLTLTASLLEQELSLNFLYCFLMLNISLHDTILVLGTCFWWALGNYLTTHSFRGFLLLSLFLGIWPNILWKVFHVLHRSIWIERRLLLSYVIEI